MRTVYLAALFAAALGAADPNTLTAEEKAAGWKLLFDGKSMKGWNDLRQQTPPGDSWTIEDGCLKAVPHPKLREDLFTAAKFGDFELAFEWKVSPGGNSGLKYRIQDRFWLDERRMKEYKKFEDLANDSARKRNGTRATGTQEYIVGFEYQVIDNGAHRDAQRGAYYQAGALYGMVPAAQPASKPVGEFNQARVIVKGKHFEHWLNGVKVAEGDMNAPAALAKTADRWTKESPIYQALANQPNQSCPIALQNHGDAAWFRNIKIRPLGK
jgi:hypothetical protein